MTLSFKDPRGWPGVLAAIGRQLPALLALSLLALPRTRRLVPPRSPDVKKGRASVMCSQPPGHLAQEAV